ncbi:MAG: response regulator transcription factor [Bryobacterales bacterium]|nr:response regulator transcription factor [Bryobacterales bacterium]
MADRDQTVPESLPPAARIRVLLADDNHGLMAELLRILRWEFEIVATAPNGHELLEAYDRYKPDVVVTDISMPVLDGFAAAEELSRMGNPPVIFFTIHDEPAFREEAKILGAAGYVVKGCPPSMLADAIRSAYREHAAGTP